MLSTLGIIEVHEQRTSLVSTLHNWYNCLKRGLVGQAFRDVAHREFHEESPERLNSWFWGRSIVELNTVFVAWIYEAGENGRFIEHIMRQVDPHT